MLPSPRRDETSVLPHLCVRAPLPVQPMLCLRHCSLFNPVLPSSKRLVFPRAGIPPDLGETETEILGKAFDVIASLVSPPQAPVGKEAVEKRCTGGEKNPTACDEEEMADDGHNNLAWRQQREEEKPWRGEGDKGDGVESSRQPGSFDALRIPASKIVSLLRAGAIDEYRRASPALSAACIYREFAEGLGAAARRGKHDAKVTNLGSTDHDDHPVTDGDTSKGVDEYNHIDDDERGSGWGVSKEEFCDYFEAVTDLVDLNGLSLVPQVQQGHAVPAKG